MALRICLAECFTCRELTVESPALEEGPTLPAWELCAVAAIEEDETKPSGDTIRAATAMLIRRIGKILFTVPAVD